MPFTNTLELIPSPGEYEPHLGIAYLKSSLKKQGFEVETQELFRKFSNRKWIKYFQRIFLANPQEFLNNLKEDPSFIDKRKYLPLKKYIDYCINILVEDMENRLGMLIFWVLC